MRDRQRILEQRDRSLRVAQPHRHHAKVEIRDTAVSDVSGSFEPGPGRQQQGFRLRKSASILRQDAQPSRGKCLDLGIAERLRERPPLPQQRRRCRIVRIDRLPPRLDQDGQAHRRRQGMLHGDRLPEPGQAFGGMATQHPELAQGICQLTHPGDLPGVKHPPKGGPHVPILDLEPFHAPRLNDRIDLSPGQRGEVQAPGSVPLPHRIRLAAGGEPFPANSRIVSSNT